MAHRSRRRLPGPLTSVLMIAAVLFALGSIGSPLLGRGVFAATDELSTTSPYLDAGFAGTKPQNTFLDDTYTSELPNEILYARSVRDGSPAAWNPYASGGIPLSSTPNYALFSPLTLPYYLLPGWLAPAYGKLLEIICATLGAYLFLRRIRLGRPAALLGGLVFAGSAFMVVWVSFPQTRVAAFIPWVFWAAERLVQRRRPTDAALLSLPVCFMLLGGFPAVAAFGLVTAAAYLVVRALAEYRAEARRLAGVLAGAAGAVLAAVGLAAVQLLPFAAFYRHWLIEGRTQSPGNHLGFAELATVFAPWTYGGVSSRTDQPFYYLPHNLVEGLSYLGAPAAVLVVAALAMAGAGRRLLPRGAWLALAVAALGWLALIYADGPLSIVGHQPVFSSNFIGRGRAILGFLLAALAATGFDLLLRRGARRRVPASRAGDATAEAPARAMARRLGAAYPYAVWLGAAVAAAQIWRTARHAAGQAQASGRPATAGALHYATGQLILGYGLLAVSLLAVAALWWLRADGGRGRRPLRLGAAIVLPALLVAQGLSLAVPYYPRTERATFFPETDVQRYLAAHLGHDRFAGTRSATVMGADVQAGLRALGGHAFVDNRFAALLRGVPGDPIPYPTYVWFKAEPATAASPVLDRVAARYFVTSPRDQVFGTGHPATGDGTVTLSPGRPVTVAVPTPGRLRAVGVTVTGAYPDAADPASWISVVVRNRQGATVATARRLTRGMVAGTPFLIPVAADQVPAGTVLTAEITAHTTGPLAVAAAGQGPALSTVTGGGDGLTLVHAGSSVVYRRDTALPRIRWASGAVVLPDRRARVAALAGGTVRADQVVLDAPGAPADGRPARVTVHEDGTDVIRAMADARGAGYLVIADADQVGWTATVDGHPARLVPADEGVVAVAVPAGRHTVRLSYTGPGGSIPLFVTITTLLLLIAVAAADRWTRRRPGDGSGVAAEGRTGR